MKTINKSKVLLLISIMIFILGYVGVNSLTYKSKNDIQKTKLKNKKVKKDTYAIMLEQDDGTYKITDSTSFNQPGYVFNSGKSECIDANGQKLDNVLSYNGATKTVVLRTNRTAHCYVYFDIKATDIEVTLKTDGVSGNLPTLGGYKNNLVCSEGIGTFNNKYQRLEISDIRANCTLNYAKDTGTHTSLINKIKSLEGTTQGNGKLEELNYKSLIIPEATLEQTSYMNLKNDTAYPWTWSDTENLWTSSNKEKSTTSVITFNPNLNGDYQICYIQSSEKNYDYGKVKKNGTEILSLKGKEATSYQCEYLGNLSTSDTIEVTYQKDGSGNQGKDELSFYIQTGTCNEKYEMINVGYRYEGQNPNNYIWFNNEMWRIIGSIPTKVDASGTITNLVKIIRKNSIGGIAYDAKSSEKTNFWGNNTLYTLLNEYYYGKHDGTNTAYCSGYSNIAKAKCDYSIKGISSDATDYYGRMVKNVYWNTGESDYKAPASTAYGNENFTQTVQGRIGLMSASDYGYAASSEYHNTNLYDYKTSDITLSNWLYSLTDEWTNIQSSNGVEQALHVNSSGDVGDAFVGNGYAYRPVVYLNENVYVISGSGTELDPYIIGM